MRREGETSTTSGARPESVHRISDDRGGAAASLVQRPIAVGQLRFVPGRLGVPQEKELVHDVVILPWRAALVLPYVMVQCGRTDTGRDSGQLMIGRRSFFIAGAALACARGAKAGLPVPPDARLAFRVMRHGSCIGSHTLDFRPSGNGLEVNIAVDVRVTFGPIPLVHYSHRAREIWLDDRLVGVSSHTDRNGRELQMAAVWGGSALSVTGSGTRPYVAPHELVCHDVLAQGVAVRAADRHAGRHSELSEDRGRGIRSDPSGVRRADQGAALRAERRYGRSSFGTMRRMRG